MFYLLSHFYFTRLLRQIIIALSVLIGSYSITCYNVFAYFGKEPRPPSHSCVVQADNTVVCWGANEYGQALPPGDTFSQVTVGGYHTCGLRTNQTLACWGLNNLEQATPPSGQFSQISAGIYHTCGVRIDQTIACWGEHVHSVKLMGNPENEKLLAQAGAGESQAIPTPPKGTFLQVSAGGGYSCGLRTDNTVTCWGPPTLKWQNSGSIAAIPNGTFSQINSGNSYSCGIGMDQQVTCWGNFDGDGRANFPIDSYHQIRARAFYGCGLKTDGRVVCFGTQDVPASDTVRPPKSTCICPSPHILSGQGCACTTSIDTTFSQLLDLGFYHACGVRTDDSISCWGYDRAGQTLVPAGLRAKSLKPTCLVYGVHNDEQRSQFIISNINSEAIAVHARSEFDNNFNIEGLDINPVTNRLYAVSKTGTLYEVRNGAQSLNEIGQLGLNEVDAISFHPDGQLWGWAPGSGVFKIAKDDNSELKLPEVIAIPYRGEMKIEDLSWNTQGSILYGIENLDRGRLWAYDPDKNEAKLICEALMNSLNVTINAIEVIADDSLVLGFAEDEKLAFAVVDVQACQITTQGKIATPYHKLKGIAWPDCNK